MDPHDGANQNTNLPWEDKTEETSDETMVWNLYWKYTKRKIKFYCFWYVFFFFII